MTRFLLLLAALFPVVALAHAGAAGDSHHTAFIEGLVHPFTGFDHLVAMLAVGMWSALAFRSSVKHKWAVVIAFTCLLLMGGMLALGGPSFAGVEMMIAASLLVLGAMIATQIKLRLAAAAALIGVFAIFHGIAHGTELPAQQALAGMVIGTMALHAIGMLLGRFVLERNVWLPRYTGAGVALLGLGLIGGAM